MSDNCLDFYFGTVSTGLDLVKTHLTLTYVSKFMFNAYVTSDALPNVKIAVSNFWTSQSGTAYVTGDEFPVILRIIADFSASEKSKVDV